MTALDHFRNLSNQLEASRVGYLAQSNDLLAKINDAAAIVAKIESEDGDATKARADLRRLKNDRANLKAPSFVDPLPDVESYWRTHKTATPTTPINFTIPAGQTALAAHNNLTEKTNGMLAEIARVASAPASDIGADLAKQVDAMATPPRVIDGKLQFARQVIDSNGMTLTVPNLEGTLAWLCRSALKQAVEKLVVVEGGMTSLERVKALNALYDKFTDALRHETAAAMAAEQAGQRVIRRRHVHPAVLLGLAISPLAVYDWFAKKRGA